MEFARELPRNFFDQKVSDLFTDFYSAQALRRLYESAVGPALGHKPQPKAPVKAKLVEACVLLAASPDKMERFIEALSPKTREAIGALLWVNKANLDEFEKGLGFEVVDRNASARENLWYELAFVVGKEFPLLVLSRVNDYNMATEQRTEKSIHFVALPPAVRAWLKPYFPKPDGYNLAGVENLPDAGSRRRLVVECSAHALQDLAVVADFLQRSGVLRNKNGTIAKGSIRKLAGNIRGGEFYPGDDWSPRLALLRHEFLVPFVDLLPAATRAELAGAKIDVPGLLRDIPDLLASRPSFIGAIFLPHLKPYMRSMDPFAKGQEALRTFLRLFRALETTRWVTKDQLAVYCRYRDLDGCFFPQAQVEFRAFGRVERYRYWSPKRLDEDNLMDALTLPLLSGLAFGLAALGLLEIAFGEPRNPRYETDKEQSLTPFEGMEAVRLTALGAYAFGKTDALDSTGLAPVGATLHFAPDRLHVRGERIDPVTEAALRDYMQPIGPGLFKMTRTSFLKSCQATAEVPRHVAAFRQRIGGDLPPLWETFFKDLAEEPATLRPERNRTIFALPENAEIRGAFSRDPVLRKHALKVEGWRVAIEEKDLSKVRARLRELGYFAY